MVKKSLTLRSLSNHNAKMQNNLTLFSTLLRNKRVLIFSKVIASLGAVCLSRTSAENPLYLDPLRHLFMGCIEKKD